MDRQADVAEPVGWCHGCGTWQLQRDMPVRVPDWMRGESAAEPEHVCVSGDEEPWGIGVWPRGVHLAACPTHLGAQTQVVTWSGLFECICPEGHQADGDC